MKKALRKIVSSVVLFSLISGTTISSIADAHSSPALSVSSVNTNEFVPDEDMLLQEEALKAYDTLYDHFEQDENYNYIYPDNYAGEYIDDHFNLVVLTSDGNDQYYRDIVADYDNVSFETVEYSYAELQAALQENVCSMLESEDTESLYCGSYVNVLENKAVIEIDKDSFSSSSSFYSDFIPYETNSPVKFEFSEGDCYTQSISVIGGDAIQNGQSKYASSFTVGMGGTCAGGIALVTCGHGLNSSSDLVYVMNNSQSTQIGTTYFRRFEDNGYGDYAFIVLNNNAQTSNKVRGNNGTISITGGYNKQLPVGTVCYKYGAVGGYCKVTIAQNNVSYNVKKSNESVEKTINGLTFANLNDGTSSGGDSGGPYYIWEDSKWKFCGVHSGFKASTEQVFFTPYMYFSGGFTCKTS